MYPTSPPPSNKNQEACICACMCTHKPTQIHTHNPPQTTTVKTKYIIKRPIREKKCLNKAKWDLKSIKYYWVCFVLSIYSWTWGLPSILSETPLEKSKFYFASRYQTQLASWLGVGSLCPFSCLSAGINLPWTQCMCHSLCELLCASVLLCLLHKLFLVR